MATDAKQQARDIVGDLRRDMEAFYSGRIDEDEARRRQKEAWGRIEASPEEVEEQVRRALLYGTPVVPEVR